MSYSIQLPDGRRARFPDTIPLEQAQQIVRRDFPDLFPKQGGVAGAFKKGAESLVSSAVAGATGIVDPEQAAREALEREQGIAQRYKDETSLDALKERYQKEGLFAAGKELVRQVPLAVAEQLPQAGVSLGSAFGGARLGAMAGSVAGPVGAGVGATVGGLAGAFAPSWLQQFGTNLSRQAAEGKTIDASSAAAAAAAQAGIETAAGAFILGKQMVGKILGRPAEKALDSTAGRALAEQSLKRTLATGAARATAVEVPTEVTQAMLERLQAGLPLTSDDALKEYGDTAYKTALSAPVFGGAARVGERGAARTQVAEEQKQETLRKQQEEQSRAAQEQDFVERQRRAQEAGVPLFAADRQALDLAEAAVTGPQKAAPPEQVDRSQEIKELQQDYARVSRAVEDIQKQIAQATQTGDVDTVAALSKQLSPLVKGRKQIEEQLASVNAVPNPEEAIKESKAEEAKLLKSMQKQAELGESEKAGAFAEKIKALRVERQQLEAQVPQVGGEQLFMETPAGFAYPEATRRAERVAEEVDTGYQAELPPAKTAETLEGRMVERQEKMRVEESRAAEEQARRDVKQLAKLMMGSAENEDIALQRVERSLDSPVSLRALGLTKPEERTQYIEDVKKGELTPLVEKLLKIQSLDQIEARIAQEREKLQGYLAEDKQLVTPDNTFTPDGMEAFATQVRINELNTLKQNQPEQRAEDFGVPAEELLVRGDDALRIAKLQRERDAAVKQSQQAKAALDALTAQPEANEEQLAAAQQRYDTTLQTVTQRDTEIEQIKAKSKIGGVKARKEIKDAQDKQDQEFGNFASALDELRQTKLGQTERGYRYYVASMAGEAAARGEEYMLPTFEQFKKDSLAKRKDALQQAVAYRNNYIVATIDEIDATRRAEGVKGVGAAERNALTKQLAKKMDELMIRSQEYYPEVIGFKIEEELVEPAVMRQGKVVRSARYEKIVKEIRRPQELPRFTPSKNITREQLAADMKAGTQAARPFARALLVTQEELAEIRDKALAREARPARSFIPNEQFTLPGIEPTPRKATPAVEEKEEEVAAAPEVGGAQMELFPEKILEPRATVRKTPEAFMRFLGSLKVSNMRKRLDDAKKKIEIAVEDKKVVDTASEKNLDRLITEIGKDVAKTAARVQQDAIKRINEQGLKDLQTLAQSVSQELAAKTRQYKSIVEKANRAEYYIPDKDRAAADKYLADLRSDLEALIAEIKDAAPTAEDKLLVNAEVALDKRLQAEKKLLAGLKAEKETRAAERKASQPQAQARRNIAILEATQRRLADLRARNKRIAEQRLSSLPGIRRSTEIVPVLDEVGRGKTKRVELVKRERKVTTPVGENAKKVERRAEPLDLSSTAAEAYALTAEEEKVLSPAEAAQTLLRGTRQGITATGAPGTVTEQIRKQQNRPLRGGEPEKAAKNIAEVSTLRQRTAGKKAQTDKDLLKLLKSFEEGIARQNDDTAFRIEEVGDTVVDLAEAQKRIDEFKSKLPEGVKFVYAETIMDAPKSFIQALYNQGMDQDSAKVRGGVLPNGTIVVVGENHTDMLDLEKTLAHELVGHYGVDTLLGPKGMDNLIETVNAQKGGMEKLASDLGVYDAALGAAFALQKVGASEQAQQRAAMRELIAHVEEARIDENFKQKARRFIGELMGAVRDALRKMGLATLAEQNPSDIYFLLRQSRINMAKSKAGAYVAGDQVVFRSAPRYGADVPENVIKTANKIVATPPGVFDKVKANNSWLAIRTQFIDRFEPLERVAAEMKDSLKATQMLYYLRMFDQRMSFTSEVTNNGALVLDKKKRDDGQEEIVVRSGGTTSLKDVATELSKATSLNADAANMLFTTYLAALRAERVGLDTLNFNPDLTQKDLDEVKAYVERTPDVKAAFNAARTKYNEYNKGLINFLVQTGTLSKESGKKLSETNDYIPFYRKQGGNAELVLGGEISPINVGNLKSQPYLNELVGDNRHILDFFTSSVQNTNLLTDMALRNLATRNVAFGLGEMGLLSRTDKEVAANKSGIRKGKDVKGSEVIRFKIDGEDYYAEADTEALGIPSDLLVKGLEGVSMTVPAAVRMLGIPAQILRKFITRNPVYALRQIIRDSTAAVMVSGANMTPVASSLKELGKMRQGKSEGEKALQERGILGGQVLTGTPEDIGKILKELVNGGKGWTLAMAKLDNFAVQGDAATRVVMYNDFRKQGLSDMEATLATLESMNFNRRGLSPSVYMLSMMVPFMNAQIQGMDVLYRAFTGKMPFNEQLKVREKLISRGLMLAGITLAYAAMMEDDETYKNADPADRYMNFFVHTPFFDEAVRVPIPFEVGYIFKALPEMVYNTAFGDTELKQIAPAIRKILSSLVPGDIPAGIKPMIELMTNYSFYSGKAIESEREQALIPAERYRAGTTEVSKAIGGLFGISPIKLDYMIRGYTGGLGVAITSIANPVLAADEKVAPEMRASDTPVVGGLFQPKDAQGVINYAYDLVSGIEQKQRTMKTMQERGRPEDVKAFIEENRQDLKLADTAGSFKRFMGELAKLERNVRERTDMTPQQKREKLDEIRQRRIKTAQRMVSLVDESKRQASR